jgi:hypothetical protein
MDEPAHESLAQFCADQFRTFDAAAWADKCLTDRRAIAVTATYLSMTSWYGHQEELERIAVGVDEHPLSFSRFNCEKQAIGLDLNTLSTKLRLKIAVSQSTLRDRSPSRELCG